MNRIRKLALGIWTDSVAGMPPSPTVQECVGP